METLIPLDKSHGTFPYRKVEGSLLSLHHWRCCALILWNCGLVVKGIFRSCIIDGYLRGNEWRVIVGKTGVLRVYHLTIQYHIYT